jgi:hypothetical protein
LISSFQRLRYVFNYNHLVLKKSLQWTGHSESTPIVVKVVVGVDVEPVVEVVVEVVETQHHRPLSSPVIP